MKKRILVVGCGRIGFSVANKLAEKGHEVTGLRRQIQSGADTVQHAQADLTCPETLVDLPSCFDLVLVVVTPSDYSEAGYRSIYVDGVGNLLAHFTRHAAAPRVIYVSSTRVYGQRQGEWVDENSVTVPADEKGRILLAAEQQVLGFGKQQNTIVRFSGIYDSNARFMQRLAEQGSPVQFEPPLYTNRIHREDCVGALVFLAEKALSDEVLAAHYLVTDNEPAPKWRVVSWLAEKTGLPGPAKETAGAEAVQGKRCCNKAIRAAGYCFKYPSYRQGYAD